MKNRRPKRRDGMARMAAIALGLCCAPVAANAQALLPVIADTYLRLDLDGDGLDDVPLPPIGTPTILELDQNDAVLEFETVASNGLSVTTAIDIEGGSSDLDDPNAPIAGIFGTVTVGMNDLVLPVGGFATGNVDIQTEIPLRFVSTTGGFVATQVDLEIAASVEGEVSYTEPTIAGFTFSTTFVGEDDDEFDVASGSFTDSGGRFGDPAFLGANSVYSFDPLSETAVWQILGADLALNLSQPLSPGATSQDGSITFKLFQDFSASNFFGTGAVVAGGSFAFEYGAAGAQLVSIRSLTPGVEVELRVPETGFGLGLALGAPLLLVLRRRARA